ncbi:hypothetical protein FRC0190_00819 [Corynebacterium rouxii]|uniref:Uncharacterized protein n=1 Tax=Corynebacterium rouxii TaxID=2719119 RepID=A0A6I8MF10_9CORY|nr:hypothetical protein FRC0190_00819 [Corynebacterium rouxii]
MKKSRRRVVRLSDAEDYDRRADTDEFISAIPDVVVPLEDGEEDQLQGLAFWKDQMPPHYGAS